MTVTEWLDEFRDMLRRRLGLIFAVAVLGTLFSVLYALSQQHRYTSIAVLQVERAKVANDIAEESVNGVTARQLQLVEQQIMSRGSVLEIGRALGLLDGLGGLTEIEKVQLLREAVDINGVAAARAGPRDDGSVSLVRIRAEWTDRENAQALAAEFARRTMERSQTEQRDRARETLDFLTTREEQLAAQVTQLEEQIAIFRRENDIADPLSREIRQREIEALKTELLALDREIIELERQLEQTEGQSSLTRVEQNQRADFSEQLNNLTQQRDYLNQRLQEASRVEQQAPEIEIKMTNFERELAALRADKSEITERRKAAEIAYRLETSGQSARFKVLEEASWPDYPSTPSRKKEALAGMMASIVFAVGLAYLLDLRTPVVRSAALMQRDLGHGPIVTIPEAKPARRPSLLRRLLRRRQSV
ncbi:Wzz/FepE/Etk N-terminal domain-containing protein [Roseovarius salis]|uniref:Wzz/FepE/Etk N-terminal domain-containing protein n=1 Tax=Roseovarius salis TaxID=3376063 RepID=UPI0037CB6669